MEPIKILTANIDKPNSTAIDTYVESGGYEQARKALTTMKPDEITQLVKDSELRGRGGAGFPTGMKWSFVPKNAPKPTYLLCNADESEPGTFKDRVLIEKDPHLLIEGMIIAGFAIGSNPMSDIYIRGEFHYGATVLEKALAEAREKGFLGNKTLGSNPISYIYIRGDLNYGARSLEKALSEAAKNVPQDRKIFGWISGGSLS